MESEQRNAIIGTLLIILLFIGITFLVRFYSKDLQNSIGATLHGVMIYLLILIIFAVFAPVSDLPLIPLAVNLWGWFFTGLLSLIGWTIGALFAFLIARKLGLSIVNKFVPIAVIHKYETLIHRGNYFRNIFFLRLLVPLDIMSYALGLFSKVDTKTYILATLLAFLPYTFLLAYLGGLDIIYQIILVLIGLIVATSIWIIRILRRLR